MEMFAEVDELSARLGRQLADDELPRAVAVLQDASALVREEVGYSVWIDADTAETNYSLVPASVRAIVLRAAERAMRNPNGFSAESSGDYSFQRTGVQIGVYLSDGEIRTLRRAVKRTGLWTQPTTRGDCLPNTIFLEDSFGFELFPVDTYYE